jgi:UDP-glucuronate 4-epimerase
MTPPAPLPLLVTGAAGFIGFHVAKRLLEDGRHVVGIDSLSDSYDVRLKRDRLALLEAYPGFRFQHLDIVDEDRVHALFASERFGRVVHLAAQVGVRASIEAPSAYVRSNVVGFAHVLEGCRRANVGHLVYASSSSVYGANTRMPYSTRQNVDHPVSLYAATKKSNELMAHTYSHLFGLPTTGLRFFTVYGPWGRPDMAYFLFTKAILEGRPVDVYNEGRMRRDFTYVDDIAEGIVRVVDRPPERDATWSSDAPDPSASGVAPYRLYNIGNGEPVELLRFVEAIERATGRTAIKRFLPMQQGDVVATYADVSALAAATGFKPYTPIEEGVQRFVDWYRAYAGRAPQHPAPQKAP